MLRDAQGLQRGALGSELQTLQEQIAARDQEVPVLQHDHPHSHVILCSLAHLHVAGRDSADSRTRARGSANGGEVLSPSWVYQCIVSASSN